MHGCTTSAPWRAPGAGAQVLSEAGGSLALAVVNGRIAWPPGDPYPEDARDLVRFCLCPDPGQRPYVDAVVARARDLLARC